MTVSTVKFYKMRGSLSSGEYPLFANGQNLSSYLLNTDSVSHQAGFQTDITVPDFTGSNTCNIVSLDGWYYWVTDWRESTTVNQSIDMRLSIMPPTSLFNASDTLTAYYERTPTYVCNYLNDDYTSGQLEISSSNNVGNDMTDYNDMPCYWIQITGVVTENGNSTLKRYGYFATAVPLGTFASIDIYPSIFAPTSLPYPSIGDAINNIEDFLPMTASDVRDISISRRCPYKYEMVKTPSPYIALLDSNDSYVLPTQNKTGATYYTYDLENLIPGGTYIVSMPEKTISFSLNNAQRMCGNIVVKDWNKNIVASFPISEGTSFTSQTYADFSGIYTIITNGRRTMTIPEGKLPWTGSGWAEYKAYQMDGDRQQMVNSIRQAQYQYDINKTTGATDTLMTGITTALMGMFATAGNPAGALIGIASGSASALTTAWENDRTFELQRIQAQDTFELSKIRAKSSQGTGYNTAYGLIYTALTTNANNLIIGVEYPINNATSLLDAYAERFGYPCEGKQSLTLSSGYYRGYAPSTTTLNGPLFDEFNRIFKQGFKFITIT